MAIRRWDDTVMWWCYGAAMVQYDDGGEGLMGSLGDGVVRRCGDPEQGGNEVGRWDDVAIWRGSDVMMGGWGDVAIQRWCNMMMGVMGLWGPWAMVRDGNLEMWRSRTRWE